MYWTLKSIPELHDLPPHDRRLIWNAARARRLERRRLPSLLLYGVLVVFAIHFAKTIHRYDLGQLVGILCGILFAAFIYRQWLINKVRPLTWEFIPGVCRKCGEKAPAGSASCARCRAPI